MEWFNRINTKENREKSVVYFLIFLLVLQGLGIFLINLLQTEKYLFMDNTLAIRHGIEMWRNGIFLKDFNYFSTMEIDNAAFFAVPLYLLTGNLGLSLGIVHLLLYILCAYLILCLFRNAGYDKKYGFLAIFLLFTPYMIHGLDWANMMFVTVGQYEFRVIVLISIANLLLLALNAKTDIKKLLPLLIFNFLLCFWTSLSCGNYVILMIVLPFCLFYVFINCILEKIIFNKYILVVFVSTVLACVLALALRSHEIGETSRSSLALLTADTFSANLLNCITGFFMLFGGLTQEPYVPIFTVPAILRIIKFVFISACLVITYMKLKKLKSTDYFHYMFIFVAIVNLAVMILAFTRYGAIIFEYRYHIVWGAMLLLVTVASVEVIKYERLKNMVLLALLSMAVLINLSVFKTVFEENHETDFEEEIIRMADEADLNTIYVYNMPDEAAAIRVLDVDKNCMSVTYVVDYVYTSSENYFEYYYDYYDYEENHLFVCPPELLEPLPEEIRECYVEIGMLDNCCVYIGFENPWIQ